MLCGISSAIHEQQKAPRQMSVGLDVRKMKPGIELFLRRATPKLSLPQQRFTSEFGKGSVWFHRAIDTRKTLRARGKGEGKKGKNLPLTFTLVHKTLKTAQERQSTKLFVRSSPRSVSTARLHTLLHFHLPPINLCSSGDLTH